MMKTRSLLCRSVLLLLALVLTASAVSCAASNESNAPAVESNNAQNGTDAPEETTDPFEELRNLDLTYEFEDYTFLIRDRTAEALLDQYVSEITENSSMIDRAVYTRNENIQEIFQVNFVFAKENLSNSTFLTKLNKIVKSGDYKYDLIVGDGHSVFQGALSNYFADWNNLEYVDLDSAWWNQTAHSEWTTPGGKLYAMNGDLCYQTIGNAHTVFFNKTILNNAKITSPYDHVYNNTWTQENFIKTIKLANDSLDHSGTNMLHTDKFGYVTQEWRGPIHVIYGTGLPMFKKEADGTYSLGWKNEACHNTFDNYFDLLFESGASYYLKSGQPTEARNAFAAATAVFTDDNLKCAVNFKGTELDFGIVPYPKATAEVDGYYSLVGAGTNTFAVLRGLSSEKLSRTSLIVEALARYGHVEVIPMYYETILSYQAMRDEHSLDMLKIIHDATFFDLGHYLNPADLPSVGRLIINSPGVYGQNIYTAFAVLETPAMSVLDKWYALDE